MTDGKVRVIVVEVEGPEMIDRVLAAMITGGARPKELSPRAAARPAIQGPDELPADFGELRLSSQTARIAAPKGKEGSRISLADKCRAALAKGALTNEALREAVGGEITATQLYSVMWSLRKRGEVIYDEDRATYRKGK